MGSAARDTGAWLRMRSARSLCAQLLGTLSAVLARAELLPASSLVRQSFVPCFHSGSQKPTCSTMSNLCSAVEGSHDGGRIRVSLTAASQDLQLHVASKLLSWGVCAVPPRPAGVTVLMSNVKIGGVKGQMYWQV